MKLVLSAKLHLPLDAVTQTFGILAVRGAGKSNCAAILAEQMAQANLPFVVIDPTGTWWGLRSSADGKGPGLSLPVFGGRKADVPLERAAGPLLADLVVDEMLSCVLDVSEFSEGDKVRFLTDFADRLYRRNETPLHLFLEEADDYIPQRPFREQARCLRAWENIVRRGRARGLGVTLISQRSAALNKMVLTQIETLIVLRTTSPQDRKAIAAWLEYHGQSQEVLASLPSLKTGEAWVWSPSWLKTLKRVEIHRRTTFDSAATPTRVASRIPATLADVDLGAIEKRMAATIERAKQEDPRELRRRIAQLEGERKEWQKTNAIVSPAKEKRVEVPVLKAQQIDRLVKHYAKMIEEADRHGKAMSLLWRHQSEEAKALFDVLQAMSAGLAPAPVGHLSQRIRADQAGVRTGRVISITGPITGPEQRILNALAWSEGIGIETPTQVAVAFLAGYTYGGGAFNNPKGALRRKGLVEYVGERFRLTAAGRAVATPPPDHLSVADLHGLVLARLPTPEQRILRILLECYPSMIDKDALAEKAGYTPQAGAFNNPLGRLRSLGLIDYPQPRQAVAKALLFLEG